MLQQSQRETSRLKSYLDALEKPLAPLGETACSDWRQEAESHLHSLIVAHQELGYTEEQAIDAALRQFGDTQRIGKNVAWEMRRQRLPSPDLIPNLLCLLPNSLGIVGVTLLGSAYQSDGSALAHQLEHIGACCFFALVPLIGGWHWQELLASEKKKWVHALVSMNFPLYGFFTGFIYASMFDLRLGAEAALSIPALIGILCFSVLGWVSSILSNSIRLKKVIA